jgi:hypothetical protein
MSSDAILKSYVRHGDKWFFVSTIERDSSSPLGSRYNETMVWEYNFDTKERGEILFQDGEPAGSIRNHLALVDIIHRNGAPNGVEV